MIEHRFKRLVVLLVLSDQRLGLSQFPLYPCLLSFERVQWQRVGEARLRELGLLPF